MEAFIDSYAGSIPLIPVSSLETDLEVSVTSVLACRFILSLRQFETNATIATYSGFGPQLQDHMASMMLQFNEQPSHSLPTLVSSFSHPVHVDDLVFGENPGAICRDGSKWEEIQGMPELTPETRMPPFQS